MLSKKAIKEFREIYHQEFGAWLSVAEATEKATQLFGLFKVLLKKQDLTRVSN